MLLAISAIFVITSCESKSGKRFRGIKNETNAEKTTIKKNDTLFFTPEKIGITQLVKDFTPYPDCDNGACIQIHFSIGVLYQEQIYELRYAEGKHFREYVSQEKAETDTRIADVKLVHGLLMSTPEVYLRIVVVNGQIVKISRAPIFGEDGNFTPSQLILTKN